LPIADWRPAFPDFSILPNLPIYLKCPDEVQSAIANRQSKSSTFFSQAFSWHALEPTRAFQGKYAAVNPGIGNRLLSSRASMCAGSSAVSKLKTSVSVPESPSGKKASFG